MPSLLPPPPAEESIAARMANRLAGKSNTVTFFDFGYTPSDTGLVFDDPDQAALFLQLFLRAKQGKSEGYGQERKLTIGSCMNVTIHLVPDRCIQ